MHLPYELRVVCILGDIFAVLHGFELGKAPPEYAAKQVGFKPAHAAYMEARRQAGKQIVEQDFKQDKAYQKQGVPYCFICVSRNRVIEHIALKELKNCGKHCADENTNCSPGKS